MPISPRASPIGLPALRASSTRELLLALLQRVGEPVQQPGAVGRGDRAPGGEGGLGARHGGVGLLDARARQLGEHPLRGGLQHRQRHARPAPAAVALGRVGPRLLDERGDHRRGLVGLRVPLHAEREAAARHLERLGQVVDRGPAR